MAKKKRCGGAPGWVVTFADLMSLLLTFFVLLLSFSEMNVIMYKQLAGAMREAFGLQKLRRLSGIVELDGKVFSEKATRIQPVPIATSGAGEGEEKLPKREADVPREPVTNALVSGGAPETVGPDLTDVIDQLRRLLKDEIAELGIEVEKEEGVIVVRFPERAAFPSGSAFADPEFLMMLDKIVPVVALLDGAVAISGHTDNRPIRSGRYRSNWDLATARAVSVVHHLLRYPEIETRRIIAQGFADTRPLAPNDSDLNRAANRRVEIRLRPPQPEERRRHGSPLGSPLGSTLGSTPAPG